MIDSILEPLIAQYLYHVKLAGQEYGREWTNRWQAKIMRIYIRQMQCDLARLEEPFKPKGKFKRKLNPSSVSSCPRYTFMHLLGAPNQIINHDEEAVANQLQIFETGNWVHYRYTALFEAMGIMASREDVMNIPEINMTGRSDVVVEIPESFQFSLKDGDICLTKSAKFTRVVVDVKSANSKSFAKMESKGPPDYYVDQIYCYMHGYDGIPGILLVENKDNCKRREFMLDYNESVWSDIEKVCVKAWESVEKLEPPPRLDCSPQFPPCSFCEKQELCWETGAFDAFVENARREREDEIRSQGGQVRPAEVSTTTPARKWRLKKR